MPPNKKRKRKRSLSRLQSLQNPIMPDALDPQSLPAAEPDPQSDSQSPPQRAPELHHDRDQPQSQLMPSAEPPAPDLAIRDPPPPPQPLPPSTARKHTGGKRKKPGPGKKRLAEINEKLALLTRNLRPIPFAPAQTLDVAKHERLFRALGLWDFAHLRLDADIRADLLALLIANYDPPNRRSDVRGKRVAVSRADLARALSLPVKKDKAGAGEGKDGELEVFAGEEAVGAVTDFIMNWVVFQDDACILPNEVVSATHLVKAGQPHRVDWAGLVWTLVEKELQETPKSGECYYASHLQCLIRHQRPELFSGEPRAEPEIEHEAEQEPSVELAPMEEDDDAVKTNCLEEIQDVGPENSFPGLTLGLGGNTDAVVGMEECKEEGGEQWLLGTKNVNMEHSLRRCEMSDIGSMECGNLIKEEEVKGEREEGRYEDDLTAKFASLEGYSSMDLLQAVATENNDYSCAADDYSIDPSTGDFLAMATNPDKNLALDSGLSGSLIYRNDGKRGVSNIDDDDHNVHRFAQGNHQQKRMRHDGHWEHATSPFDICAEQTQSMVDKLKMLYAEKEQACTTAQLEVQYLNNLLHEKDQIFNSLQKTRLEEQQKRDLEFCRLQHELKIMHRLVLGYKNALKETRSSFAEYRKRFPQEEKPIYTDVPGSDGLVLSTTELERQRILREEAACQAAVEMINSFQKEWFLKLNEYSQSICDMAKRLVKIDEEYACVKKWFVQSKNSDT